MRRSLIPPPRGGPAALQTGNWPDGTSGLQVGQNWPTSAVGPPSPCRLPSSGFLAEVSLHLSPDFPISLSLSQSPVLSRAQRLGEGQGPGIRFPLPRGSREVVEMNDGVFQWDNQEVAALTPKGARRGRLRGRWRGLPSWRPGPRPRWSSRCPCSPRTAGASPASRLAACARRCRS